MYKKIQILIVSAAVLFTVFFVWSTLTTDNSITDQKINDNRNISQNAQDSSTEQKPLEGATIIDNTNKGGNTAQQSSNNDSVKDTNNTAKAPNDASSTPPVNQASTENNKVISNTVSSPGSSTEPSETYTIYEVKQGETLSSICKQFAETSPVKVTAKAILTANNLKESTEIRTGMRIKIPSKYSNGSRYTIALGDSLYTIASSYMDDMDIYEAIAKIKKDNFLISDNIKTGDELFLAGVSKIEEQKSLAASTSTSANVNKVDSSEKYISYTVKEGETLASICKQYEKYCPVSISSKAILKVNKLSTSAEVKEGITINIPESYFTKGQKYTIKYGDSLTQIAATYMKDLEMYKAVEKIMKDNFKTSDNIRIGEEIFIASSDL